MLDPRCARAALKTALKEQLRTTPYNKITVSSLAAAAGINRQTFYYHFADVRDLTEWTFTTEIADYIMAHATYDEWADGFLSLLTYMSHYRDQAIAIIHSLHHKELEQFFFQALREMTEAIVDELEGDLILTPDDRNFIIDHFTLTTVGHLLHWFAGDLEADPRRLVENLEYILHGQVRRSLEIFAEHGGYHPTATTPPHGSLAPCTQDPRGGI